MNKPCCLAMTLLLTASAAGAAELSGLENVLKTDRGTGSSFGLLYDGGSSIAPAPAPVDASGQGNAEVPALARGGDATTTKGELPPPASDDRKKTDESGVAAGIKNGGQQGALGGFYAVISPAAALLSEGFSRDMSRHYDGTDSGSSGGYWAAGIALGVLLYIPALVAGGLGAVGGAAAGAVSEMASPGSTKGWDVEKKMFG